MDAGREGSPSKRQMQRRQSSQEVLAAEENSGAQQQASMSPTSSSCPKPHAHPSSRAARQAGSHCPTFALPMGTVKSLSSTASSTGKGSPYKISFSSTTTGSGSRMAAFSRPRASSLS